ncbi:MAG: hypothetical protein ACQESD_04065 [Thermoplasmatota archaeon]
MTILTVGIIVLGLLVLLAIIWAVWQLVKCVIVILLVIAILIALWYFGAFDGISLMDVFNLAPTYLF